MLIVQPVENLPGAKFGKPHGGTGILELWERH